MKKLSLSAALLVSAIAAPALAAPVAVTQVTTGSAGNWTYNFTFTNNVGQGQRLYFFGVLDSAASVSASPSGYSPYPGYTVNNTAYNLAWLTDSNGGIASGQSMGGFAIRDTAQSAKSGFNFFGYTYAGGAAYTGGQSVGGNANNPAFEFSSATATAAVPEPATWAMMFLGFAGLGYALRRRPERSARIRFA